MAKKSKKEEAAQIVILRIAEGGEVADRTIQRNGFACHFAFGRWGYLQHITEDPDVARAFAYKDDGQVKSREYDVFNMAREGDREALERYPVNTLMLRQRPDRIALRVGAIKDVDFLTALLASEKNMRGRADVIAIIENARDSLLNTTQAEAQAAFNADMEARVAALEEKVAGGKKKK